MKILLTCHRDPFANIGGSEEVIRQLALRLSEHHQVTVATSIEGGLPPHEVNGAVTIERFALKKIGGRAVFSAAYRHLAARGGWDVVLLFGQGVWVSDSLFGFFHRIGAKIIYMPVGFYGLKRQKHTLLRRIMNSFYYSLIQPYFLKHADVVVALTDGEVEDVRQMAKPKHLVKIPCGVDFARFQQPASLDITSRFSLPTNKKILVNIGGNYENKRLDCAAAAVKGRDDYLLLLCGKDTERLTGGNVRGLGYVGDEEIVALLQQSHALLLTSDFEGFGLVLLEVLACGKPFISTAVGVAPELAARGAGIIVDCTRPGDAILTFERRAALPGQELKALAQTYDWHHITKKIEDVFNESLTLH